MTLSSNRHSALPLCLSMSFFAKPVTTFAGHALMADEFRCRGRQRLRCLIELLHQLLDFLAAHWRDLELHLFGVGEELGVLHGIVECGAQGLGTILRDAGRGKKWPAHHLARE